MGNSTANDLFLQQTTLPRPQQGLVWCAGLADRIDLAKLEDLKEDSDEDM